MKASEQLDKLFLALSKAQGMLKAAVKDASNPFFKSKYASFAECVSAGQLPLATHELTVIQCTEEHEGKWYLRTILGHASGQYISYLMPILAKQLDSQSFGSAVSYMKRYGYCAVIGLTVGDEDDDGEKAMGVTVIDPTGNRVATKKDCITENQVREIESLIGNDPIYTKTLLEHFDIVNFSRLPASRLAPLLDAVKKRNEAKKASL